MSASQVLGLVKKLRECSQANRKSCALELAKTGADKAVGELMRMVRGARRFRLRWYSVEDQLIGVEALGETASPKAFAYLNDVYRSVELKPVRESVMLYYGGASTSGDIWGEEIRTAHVFPQAPRRLSARLRYTTVVSNAADWMPEYCQEADKTEMRARDEKIHALFSAAFAKLRL